ncbi:hypothetical protein [Persicitalea jodogahamensis]|uniref:Uncharacterized protein n=1 Tax=Persicitalea jodogahamensis TaxID=402147 RepID=A0A8J3D6A6_9BACT|nr:hypothetical protein [Persicitalea jodogahamensis]GHB80742.1 hypothetical protein GCM10007390_39050 [Persicitalea jodogahamensis]
MKKSIKTLICALALGTTVAFAGPGDNAKKPTTFGAVIYKNIDGGVNVNVEKSVANYVAVLVTNANGDLLARQSIGKKEKKACIKFNLQGLQDGAYKISVVGKGEKMEKEFTITSQETVVERMLTFE